MENIIEIIKQSIDWVQRFWFVIFVVSFIIIFFYSLISFKKKCKAITNKLIKEYSDSGKYIKGLFVELNDSKEYIRAFCFSRLWKQKVIRNYNTLFNDKMGKELPKVYPDCNIQLRYSYKTNFKKLKTGIYNTLLFYEKICNREPICNPYYKNTNMLYELYGGEYLRKIKKIEKLASYLDSKYMIITGTAGNGKSMMLCSVAELLVSKKSNVIFFNARDIQENLISYLIKNVMHEKLIKVFELWWNLQEIIHMIMKKDIYIIVDAINENENTEFLESLSTSIERLLKFKHVKLIISCRSEYYDLKYEKYLFKDKENFSSCYLDLQGGEYSNEAKERLINNYAHHYNFKGDLSEEVKEKITRQLLLVRILFEFYSGKTNKIYELNKYELYKQYIDGADNKEIGILLKELARYMFENKIYENIQLLNLGDSFKRYQIIDASILVCRSLIKHAGTLREETVEVINFVYDEMRDYRLSVYLLDVCVDKAQNVNYDCVKNQLLRLRNEQAICLEGIINYIYNYCVVNNNTEMQEFILFKLIKQRDDHMNEDNSRRNRHISSWGLTLLLETDSIESDFGKKYVDYILRENPAKEGEKLLCYLLKQEYSRGKNTLGILLNAFLRIKNKDDLANALRNTISSWSEQGVTVSDLTRIHEILIKENKDGADRFLVYMYLLTIFFNWNGRDETKKYIKKVEDYFCVEEYINKLKENIS